MQGLTLATPELVPFRLTQNLLDGFGITGAEGVFRRSAEVALAVLRHNRAALVRVLHHQPGFRSHGPIQEAGPCCSLIAADPALFTMLEGRLKDRPGRAAPLLGSPGAHSASLTRVQVSWAWPGGCIMILQL